MTHTHTYNLKNKINKYNIKNIKIAEKSSIN